MAKKNREDKFKITFVPFLWIGFVIVCVTALLQIFIPAFPTGLKNVLYLVGVMCMVLYMFQGAYEKRTGKRESDAPEGKNSGKKRK